MKLRLREANMEDSSWIRMVRNSEENSWAFGNQRVGKEEHEDYMAKNIDKYWICESFPLYGWTKVGWCGIVDKDIRICTHPQWKGKGVCCYISNRIKEILYV